MLPTSKTLALVGIEYVLESIASIAPAFKEIIFA